MGRQEEIRRRPGKGKGAEARTVGLNFERERQRRNERAPVRRGNLESINSEGHLQELWLGGVPHNNTYQRGTLIAPQEVLTDLLGFFEMENQGKTGPKGAHAYELVREPKELLSYLPPQQAAPLALGASPSSPRLLGAPW